VTLKRTAREHWRAGRAAALTAMLLGLLIAPFPSPLERWSFDWLHSTQPATNAVTQVREIAMVYMDDLSHANLSQKQTDAWHRELHARLLTALAKYEVKAIALDLLFTAGETNDPATMKLAAAIKAAPQGIVLAADLGSGDHAIGGAERMRLELPDPTLLAANAAWGFTQLQEDGSYDVREHFHGTKDVPSLSWRLATLLGSTNVTESSQRQKRWMHYYGPHGTIPFLRYDEVLEKSDANVANLLRGRVIFVGSAIQPGFARDRRDQFKTPYWREAAWPGVDFHATQFLNLWRGDWLRRPNPFVELLIIAVGGLVAGITMAGLRPLHAVIAAVVMVLLVLLCASALTWQNHIWLNWVTIAGIQVPVALAFSLLQFRHAQRMDGTIAFPRSPASKPITVADHELLRKIGGGSYGEVWLARNVTGTLRAVKLVASSGPRDPRLEREFAGLKKFEPISRLHPGLVHILHLGRDESIGGLYYIMELADSTETNSVSDPSQYAPRTLKSDLQSHDGLTASDCTELSLALTSALAFLHEQGLIHRDIKPSNIIFVGNRPKLADIGLVAGMDETLSFVGTEGYIPPEGPGTTAADVYSLGKLLSEVLAASQNAPALDALHAVIGKATAQNVAHRYQTAAEMLRALRAALANQA